ncbi:hypothetical protein HWB05_gp024 [Streptomyces phage BRock]|uniref:Uncharacterized protein n=1 Tax=Streptomyces phage BRock TaxID=1913591 RepID=A0A1J0GVT5_9CAUD|nr:hypothetical protein HWB05_gp024 [Streptomyces phage BRock]APC46286.1 hypothetical protein [Streptomyces phage BRock]
MATRNRVAQSNKITESAVLTVMAGFPGDMLTPVEIAGEIDGATDKEVFDLLNTMEDAGKVTGEGRGLTSKWSIGGAPENPVQAPAKPKRTRRTKAEMEAARKEAAERTAYNARVAETQDMDMSQSAESALDVMAKGEAPSDTVTTLPSAASLLGEGQSLTIPTPPVAEPVKPRTVRLEIHEPKNGECPGNDIPECPEWCPVNVWELAHDANTESARNYWGKRVAQYQADAQPNYDENEDKPPF